MRTQRNTKRHQAISQISSNHAIAINDAAKANGFTNQDGFIFANSGSVNVVSRGINQATGKARAP